MQKTCFKCKRLLYICEFYRHPQMPDGHLNKCKICARKDASENYAKRREQYSEYDHIRQQRADRKSKKLLYQQKQRLARQDEYKARGAVNRAVRDGKLQKKPCQFCGNHKSEAHHEDYGKPLDVIWACFKCHREKFHGQTVSATV